MANVGHGIEGEFERMMKPDKLLLASDIAGIEPNDITDAVKEQLTANAEAFLSAGGVLSLDDWAELSPVSRAAFIAARKRLRTSEYYLGRSVESAHEAKPAGKVLSWP